MKLKTFFAVSSVLLSSIFPLNAQSFFDTGAPDKLVGVGVRVGVNTSVHTSSSAGKISNIDSWGTGFDGGFVVDLNLRDFLTVQPGFFFESRSHDYDYVYDYMPGTETPELVSAGHTRSTWFKVPVIGSVRFNPANKLRWALDVGPVFGFGLSGSDKSRCSAEGNGWENVKNGYFDTRKKWSFGWKLGTSLRYAGHYLIGIHYEAGSSSVYKSDGGGRYKTWIFSLGYDF